MCVCAHHQTHTPPHNTRTACGGTSGRIVYCGDDSTRSLGVPKQVQREGTTKNIQGINKREQFVMRLHVCGGSIGASGMILNLVGLAYFLLSLTGSLAVERSIVGAARSIPPARNGVLEILLIILGVCAIAVRKIGPAITPTSFKVL